MQVKVKVYLIMDIRKILIVFHKVCLVKIANIKNNMEEVLHKLVAV
jgi:hypothetical protein